MRRGLPVAVCVVLAAGAAAVALAQGVVNGPPAQAATAYTAGAFGVSSSRDDQPIFAAGGIAPGGSARGTVAIEDTGSAPVALTLHRGELVDTPGLGGAILSARLQLTVVDVTSGTPQTVYSGPLASMPAQPAGRVEPGEARTYEFTATLPTGGAQSFQNAVQGASITVAYSWQASEAPASEAAPPEEPSRPSGPRGPSAPFDLTVPAIRHTLRHGHLIAWTACDQPCRVFVRGRLRATGAGTSHGRHRAGRINFATAGMTPAGPHRLRIPVPGRLRHWISQMAGRERLRARLRFVAVDPAGDRAALGVKVRLRGAPAPRRPTWKPHPPGG